MASRKAPDISSRLKEWGKIAIQATKTFCSFGQLFKSLIVFFRSEEFRAFLHLIMDLF